MRRVSSRSFVKTLVAVLSAATLWLACSGLALAQTCPSSGTYSYDLLGTPSGSSENLSSVNSNLGVVTFQGVPLSTDTGNSDTIVKHDKIPNGGGTAGTQIWALHLISTSPVWYNGQWADVHAVINRASGLISLPEYDTLPVSCGQMTVYSSGTFDSSFGNIQPDIVVVPQGGSLTGTVLWHGAAQPDPSVGGSGGQWFTYAPPGYPTSQNFPTQSNPNFYVHSLAGGGYAMVTGPTGRLFRGGIYGIACLLMCLAMARFWSVYRSRRFEMGAIYMLGLAVLAWFAAWKMPRYPTITYAQTVTQFARAGGPGGSTSGSTTTSASASTSASCIPPGSEAGQWIAHLAGPAGLCQSSKIASTSIF